MIKSLLRTSLRIKGVRVFDAPECYENQKTNDMKDLVLIISVIAFAISVLCMNILAIVASLIPFFSAFIPELYDGAKEEIP